MRLSSDAVSSDVVDQELEARIAAAREVYPSVTNSDADVAAHVASKLVGDTTLDRVDVAQLFLALACARRDPAALAIVERETFGEIDAAYRRFADVPVSADDVRQRMREKLFVGASPAILKYGGLGSLRSWVRASVLNLLLTILKRESREAPTDEALFDVVISTAPGADAAYMKLASRAELEAALGSAMSGLGDRDQALLRHAYVDGRSIDEIGAVYAVHRATAARWVAAARIELVTRTLEDLMHRLQISETEARSIVAAGLSGVGSMLLAKLG